MGTKAVRLEPQLLSIIGRRESLGKSSEGYFARSAVAYNPLHHDTFVQLLSGRRRR